MRGSAAADEHRAPARNRGASGLQRIGFRRRRKCHWHEAKALEKFGHRRPLGRLGRMVRQRRAAISEFSRRPTTSRDLDLTEVMFPCGSLRPAAFLSSSSRSSICRRLSHLSATVMDPAMARAPASRGCGLGYTDQTDSGTTVNSIGDVLDFSQSPRSFQMIPSSCAASCIESETLPTGPPDDK